MSGSAPLAGVEVLVLTSGHPVDDSRVFFREAAALADAGATVTLVGQAGADTPAHPGVTVIGVPAPRSRPQRFLVQPWRCAWAARRVRPAVVHIHDAELLAVVPALRLRWRRAKVVYDVHEDFAELMTVREWVPAPLRGVVRALTRAAEAGLARLVHAVVGVTPPLAGRFPGRPGVTVANYPPPSFVEQADRALRPPRARRYDVVHLGTLSAPRAGFLLEVLRLVHRLRPGTSSLVVGMDARRFEAMRAEVPPGCDIRGKVPFEAVAGLLADARLGIDVHPWLTPHLLPALPVKVCEYMLCGCAVVSSTMPVLAAVAEEVGAAPTALVLLDSSDPADYAAAAVSLLDRIDAGDDPGASLRATARRGLVWEREAERLVDLYRTLLGGRCDG